MRRVTSERPRGILSPLPPEEPTLEERWSESNGRLVARLREEIRAGGPITFARFMEVALYEPRDGYYARRADRPTRAGDFLTAPEMDPIFGTVLAVQLEECWERLGRPRPFIVRDEGAGSGSLGQALIEELRRREAPLLTSLAYVPVEASPSREAAVRDRLADAGLAVWLATEASRDRAGVGVVVANELLDALPVHRLLMRDGRLTELYVTWRDGWFADEPGVPSDPALVTTLEQDGLTLAEGQRAEVSLAAQAWVRELPQRLARGYAIVIDYGGPATELFGERNPGGLLRGYRAHHVGADPYRAVGEQDLTAHVDATALERTAVDAGLLVLGRTTQAEFLAGLEAAERLAELGARPGLAAERYRTARGALLRLLDPAAMGRFMVLLLGCQVALEPPLRGLAFRLPRRS